MNALARTAQIAVIGAGAMGAGIAQVAAQAGHPVLLFDVREGAALAALERIVQTLDKLVAKGRLAEEMAKQIQGAMRVIDTLDGLADADLVIEAIVEDIQAKRDLFVEVEKRVSPKALLATNTSSVSVTAIAASLKHPERFAGLHFFNPAPLMALVEVVAGLETSPQTRQCLFETARAWGKEPVQARSTPGFIVNRVARPFYAEALRLLEEGVADVATLDALVREGGGFRMGPFELMDLIGHDVNAAVTRSVFESYFQDPRFKPSLLQQELVAAGRLGRKSGRGFYDYTDGAIRPIAQEAPDGPQPVGVCVEGDMGPAEVLVEALQRAGISVERRPGAGLMRLPGATLALTEGRSATARSAEDDVQDLVLFDLALDYAKPGRIALAKADQASNSAIGAAAQLFRQVGWSVSVVDDSPALVVMRTVAMLANEAADAVLQGVACPEDIDRAMCFGTNYPRGPLAWAQDLGPQRVLQVLANLQSHYGDDRYRPSAWLRRRAISQQALLS